ncbi:YadA-like family protein [Bartonella sp. CL436QHHD]|uniref:YadA-like family protein n=2 Tax=unclassified Bartonella TaxID=2645622 RepID=UPI0035CF1600
MKKLYTKLAGSNLKFSRFPFIKVLSLTSIAALLASISPVFSNDLDSGEEISSNIRNTAEIYPQSIVSVYDSYNSDLDSSSASQENYLTALNVSLTSKVSAADDYANFLTKTLTGVSDYSPIVNVLVKSSDSIRSIDMNAGSEKITRAALTPSVVKGDQITRNKSFGNPLGNPLVYGERAQGESHDAIVYGQVAQTKADQGIAIGLTALAGRSRDTKNSIAIGSSLTDSYDEKQRTVSFGDFSIAFGSKAHSYANEAIAMGYNAYAQEQALQGIAIGASSNVTVAAGVALGSDSVADRAAGELGYTSLLQGSATNVEAQWKSTRGSVSVGDYSKGITRQITGVAAGSNITDAVNLKQLQDLEQVVRQNGWKFSVGDKNATTVLMDSAVDFSAGSSNLNITKGEDDNKVKFDLAQDIALESVKAGKNTFDATGLVITDGPKIIISGIDAGGKKITGVSDGTGANDAVNFSQLSKTNEGLSSTARNLETAMANTSKYFGGGAGVAGSDMTGPTYDLSKIDTKGNITEGSFKDVGSAFTGLDTNIKNVNARIKEVSEGVAQDSLLWNDEANAFVARHEKRKEEKGRAVRTQENSRITFLESGEITQNSTDAVNGGQLYTMGNTLASYFGGGAGYDEEGKWKAPDFKIKQFGEDGTSFDKNYQNVADALSGVGTSITNVQNKLTEQVNNVITKVESESFIQQDKTTSRLTIGAKVGGAEINIANESGADRIISGVGEAKNNNDAVNKSQLDSNIKNVNDNVTNKFSELTKNITNITQQVKGDALLWNDKANAFVARHEKKQEEKGRAVRTQENSRITFLLDGVVSKDSTDAVTGGQLYSLNEQLATYFGGGAGYDEQGQWKAPSFKVKTVKDDGKSEEIDYGNVTDALAGVGNSFTNIRNEISKEINNEIANVKGDSLVKKDQATKFITIGKEVEGSEINIANSSKADRTLSGVKAATQNNEAVNKGQLDESLKKLSNSLQSDDSAVVHYDKKEGDNNTINYASVTLGKGANSAAVALHNVADGQIAKGSHDTVTGGQLHIITDDFSKILGGDVSFDGKNFKVPGYKLSNIDEKGVVTDKPHTDVGSAFKGLDDNIKNVNARIKEVSEGVAQDSLSWSDADKAFVAQHGEGDDRKASKITSLAVGDITKESMDAVNGSQLYSLGDKVAKYFSDDAEYKDGELKVPDFKLKIINDDGTEAESSYKNVSDAFSGVGKLFTKVQTAISDVISNLLVTKNEDVINIGKGVEGSEINIANKSGKDRTLSGVKAAEKANEAVNKEQFDKGLKDLSDTLLSDSSSVVLYDKTTDNQTDYTNVTFGKGKDATPVALHNVAAGSIAENSTDVINGGQVHILSMDIAKLLGGDAEFKGGAFKGPTYNLSSIDKGGEVTDKPHTDVGSAFKGLDDNIKNVNARIKEVSEGVAQDSLSWSDGDKAFIALHGKGDDRKASKITSLAAGSIVSGSSDAVNGGQIYDLNQSLAKYFGGDAKYDGDGWALPGFKIMTFQEDGSFEEENYDSIAAAFAGVNKVFKNLHNEISDNIEQNALLWSDDAGAFVAQHEKEGNKENSKITFLAKGKISEDSTDAINGGQIYTLQQTFASYFGGGAGYDKEGNWQGPKFTVQVFNKDGTKGDKEERNNVSEAFDVVNDSMSTINDRIKEVEKGTSLNSLNWNEEKGSYDASHVDSQGVKSPSKIINVANGKVDRDSKEAVNGGQLWETQQMITDQVKDIENRVTEGSVQYDKDKETGKKTNKVSLVGGDESSPVLIANVADGKIEKDSKEAVNGGQLKDKMDFVLESANKYTDEQISHLVKDGVSGANSYTDMKFSTLSYAVEDVRKEARQAAAVGLAVAGLRYSDIPGKLTIAFGSGLWRSQSAFAFGAGYTSENGDIGSNLSITTSGGHWGISTGVNVILN